MSDGSVKARRMYRATSLAPSSASASEAGVASRQCSESTACDSASIPDAAVTGAGQDSVRSGSTSAIRGQLRMSKRFIFFLRAVSVMTADGLTSLPVPAVVGIAMTGSGSCVSAPKSSQSRGCPPLVSSRPMHLAVSIADPPPTATSSRWPPDRIRSAPARQSVSLGLGRTWSKTVTAIPAAVSARLDRRDEAGGADAWIGDEKDPVSAAERGDVRDDLRGDATTEQRPGRHVELAVRGDVPALAPERGMRGDTGGRPLRAALQGLVVLRHQDVPEASGRPAGPLRAISVIRS